MVIPNMVSKFHNFDIFWQICDNLNLSSVHACRVLSVHLQCFMTIYTYWLFAFVSLHTDVKTPSIHLRFVFNAFHAAGDASADDKSKI